MPVDGRVHRSRQRDRLGGLPDGERDGRGLDGRVIRAAGEAGDDRICPGGGRGRGTHLCTGSARSDVVGQGRSDTFQARGRRTTRTRHRGGGRERRARVRTARIADLDRGSSRSDAQGITGETDAVVTVRSQAPPADGIGTARDRFADRRDRVPRRTSAGVSVNARPLTTLYARAGSAEP